jgi:hypothetical protein
MATMEENIVVTVLLFGVKGKVFSRMGKRSRDKTGLKEVL